MEQEKIDVQKGDEPMIFNEKALIRMLKQAFRNGNLIYGQIDDYILFGGTNWRGCIEENFVTQGIYGEMLKLTGIYPKKGSVFTINKERIAQYTIVDMAEFKDGVNEASEMMVSKIVYDNYKRILIGKDGLLEVYEGHVEMLDQTYVTDEEDRYEGPFFDSYRNQVIWRNDVCELHLLKQYTDEECPELETFEKIIPELEYDGKYTFH